MQTFEIVANLLALLVLIALAVVHVYGRRTFEPGGHDPEPDRRH